MKFLPEMGPAAREIFAGAKWPLRALALVILLSILKGVLFYEVPAGYVALRYTWGKLDTSYSHNAGLMFRVWPVQSAELYPVKLAVTSQKGEAADSKNQLIDTAVAVQLLVKPEKAAQLRKEIGNFDAVLTTVVEPNIYQALKSQTVFRPVESLVLQRGDLVNDVKTRLQKLIDNTLAEKNITDALVVVQVGITQFDFRKGFLDAIDRKVMADQKAFTAETQKEIDTINADANGQRTEILAEAHAYETAKVGAAEAYRIEKLGTASQANRKLGIYEAVQNWNKQSPGVNIGGSSVNLMLGAPAAQAQGDAVAQPQVAAKR